jgi:hypothetical protein
MNQPDTQTIPACLDQLQTLLWRMDLTRQTFQPLNHCPSIILNLENYRFFKDREFRQRMLHEDDRATIEQIFHRLKKRNPVNIIFRIRHNDKIHWFRLNGWPTKDPRYFVGGVEDISDQLPLLQTMLEDHNRQLLEHIDLPYPVALFTWPDCTLHRTNQHFIELIGPLPDAEHRILLTDLIKGCLSVPALLETLISERHLTTDLVLSSHNSTTKKQRCRLEHFSYKCAPWLRLAVLDHDSQNTNASPPNLVPTRDEVTQLCRDLDGCRSITEMLERIYQSRGLFPQTDVVMFSDIYARRNKIMVYAKGEMKEELESGAEFPYTGTIAENIVQENLEYLIVDDTQSSIKAIDWILFVPKGINSYMAKARYERGAMRTVLILGSKHKNSFSTLQIAALGEITTAFHKKLKKIRRKDAAAEH